MANTEDESRGSSGYFEELVKQWRAELEQRGGEFTDQDFRIAFLLQMRANWQERTTRVEGGDPLETNPRFRKLLGGASRPVDTRRDLPEPPSLDNL